MLIYRIIHVPVAMAKYISALSSVDWLAFVFRDKKYSQYEISGGLGQHNK